MFGIHNRETGISEELTGKKQSMLKGKQTFGKHRWSYAIQNQIVQPEGQTTNGQ